VNEKPIVWLGSSLVSIRAFPDHARQRAGRQLHLVQEGQEPSDWKPVTTVGPGVREIRIHDRGEFRVLFIAQFVEAVYVLHVFEKKTRKTRAADIQVARHRLRHLTRRRPGGSPWL
jgi:phage-related protein